MDGSCKCIRYFDYVLGFFLEPFVDILITYLVLVLDILKNYNYNLSN
jgi:hypothetical protein